MREARVAALGFAPVKGSRWRWLDRATFDDGGILGDRAWALVDDELRCLRSVAHPELARWEPPGLEELAGWAARPGGGSVTVTYWGRPVAATVHGGPGEDALLSRLSDLTGVHVRLAHTHQRPGFVWDRPVSLVLASELVGLPGGPEPQGAGLDVGDEHPDHSRAEGPPTNHLQTDHPQSDCSWSDRPETEYTKTGRQSDHRDAGIRDAGVRDAGVGKAGVGHAGVGKAGVGHAGARDVFVGDAGVGDAGPCGTDAVWRPDIQAARYRPNVLVDDLAHPLRLHQGQRLRLGHVELVCHRRLERCTVIDHDPVLGRPTSRTFQSLPDRALGWGCDVLAGGDVSRGTPVDAC